ncbi:methyl-accepting chemotaxis protein [Psychrobacter sp. I-STPA10]|uniref:methyl-accepting chemotaxis protein n=1 Tax=Psychrobacter sp. I-STPA10 TaxID=2585769 RepID=UPI002E788B50|nr:methyl-accepting chemotaxis protein [Psychrobacter sp. I-STPA10]
MSQGIAIKDESNQPLLKSNNKRKRWIGLLWLFLIVSIVSLILLVVYLDRINNYIHSVYELDHYSSRIINDINEAAFTQDYEMSSLGYENLQKDIQGYERALYEMQRYTDDPTISNDLLAQWQQKKPEAEGFLNNRNNTNIVQDSKQQFNEAASTLHSIYARAIEQATAANATPEQIASLQEQIKRIEQLGRDYQQLLDNPEQSPSGFNNLRQRFAQNLNQQVSQMGGQVPALQEAAQLYNKIIEPVTEDIPDLQSPSVQSTEQARELSEFADNTQKRLASINRNLLEHPYVMGSALGLLFGVLGVLYSLFRLYRLRGNSEKLFIETETLRQRQDMQVESERAQKIQEENERNQMAILRLLDELGDLAEGDLTVNATVSEDFTGAIADSVNFAIDQLRQLVLAINTTAVRVAQSSEATQLTAIELAEASEQQAQEIAGVSAAINEMAVSIDQVSANAAQSTAVAKQSVAIAYNGAEVVQRSIEGMNTIREQIQETSKRIKRLGESSQEIGDIVGLINDIADQTNVLALNAAIQASMAGEAGRGFAVVADEVQRLAERSANATKQIETLVKTIQADTNEAVMSMESTTTEVVRGARLAKDAGEALEEVQTVSNTLADLIQNISEAAQQQASSAGHISKTMDVIQDITSQTSSGTLATARSVGQLNEMAAALQESVSGFKLDDSEEELEAF